MKQMTLAAAADSTAGFERFRKPTRRDAFLAEMQTLVPWDRLVSVIEPYYPKPGNGRPPIGVERMLRIHLLQHWFNLADAACEEALYDSAALRAFAGIDLGREPVPDATTILKFRHLLERHNLGQTIFAEVGRILQERGLRLSAGTIVDATIIAVPSSTKNADQRRDPEMKQTRKGNQWHFGMKVPVGVDAESGLVHTVRGTAGSVNDVLEANALLHGEETEAFGDAGYQGAAKRPDARPDVRWNIAMRPGKRRALDKSRESNRLIDELEKLKASIRAKVEHPFRVIKRQFGHVKVRYRGLAKNTAQLHTLFALSNLWMVRRQLGGVQA